MSEISSFGYWVRRRRKALDLTQTDLARQVFCSLSTIKKIELDERRPSQLMAERLADCLHVDEADRKMFLAVANAVVTADRFQPNISSFSSNPSVSTIQSYEPLNPFVGYDRELTEICKLITDKKSRLITIVGPGGVGKTRLARQVAIELSQHFSGKVFFVSLAQIDNPVKITPAILDSLSVSQFASSDPKSHLIEYLRDKTVLLVLDNFEHLLEGARILVDLFGACPSVVVLTTTRVPLSLSIEQVFEVRGLRVDPMDGNENPETTDAVKLFLEIARRAGSQEILTRDNIETIVRICKLVEGMPLAIEIAGSWARTRSFSQIEAGIKSDLEFLTSRMHDVTERHRSVQAAFEFSWKILSDEEKRAFSILSIFQGSFDLPAIETIAATDQDTVDALVSKSLLYLIDAERYYIHELLRRYSERKLKDSQTQDHYRKAHLSYYLNLAESSLFHRVEKDIDNFRAALQTAIEHRDQDYGLRLTIALDGLWHSNGYLLEGQLWFGKVLEQENGQFPYLRAKAFFHASKIAQELGDFEQALRLSRESLSLFKKLNDKAGVGRSLMIMGIVRYLDGEFERGIMFLKKSLSIFEEIGDEEDKAQSLIRLADANMKLGQLDLARGQMEQALIISTALNNRYEMAFSLGGMGEINRLQGKYYEAFELFKESINIHWQEHHRLDLPYLIEALAMDFASLGYLDKAAILWGAAESQRSEIHSPLPPSYRQSYAPAIEHLRKQIGEARYFASRQAGQKAPLEEILSSTLSLTIV